MRSFKGMTVKEFGTLLKKYRITHGYKQQDLADLLGVERSTYSKYETIRFPEIDRVLQLSAFYDISLDALFEPFISNSDNGVSKNLLIASPELDDIGDDVINSLSADEKKLVLYYRNSYRKDEIMNKAYDILCSDSAVADEIED